MNAMLETDMQTVLEDKTQAVKKPELTDTVREHLAKCVHIDPVKGEQAGVIVVPTSRMLRVDRATALGLSPMLGNEIHEAMRYLVEMGEVELVLVGVSVTHMRYRLIP